MVKEAGVLVEDLEEHLLGGAETSLMAVLRLGLAARGTCLGGSAVPGADDAGSGEPVQERAAG
jgi:hypothetical protein